VGAFCPHLNMAIFSIFLIFEIYIINMNKKEGKAFLTSPGIEIKGRFNSFNTAMIYAL
jgi:hypothetical protein